MAKRNEIHREKPKAPNPSQAKAAEFFGAVISEKTTNESRSMSEPPKTVREQSNEWLSGHFEGQLTVDVFQTDEDVVIQSTLAGVRVEDIDISVNNDMVTIRGIRRRDHEVRADQFFYQECYWGGFSRSIILPVDVKGDKVTATLKNGILTVVLPKADKPRAKSVRVREESDEEGEGT